MHTSITTPGYEDIMGVAFATNPVTVNSGATDRKVEYFHREISVANGSSPVWQAVTFNHPPPQSQYPHATSASV